MGENPKKDTGIEWYESECDITQCSIWEIYPEMVNNVKEYTTKEKTSLGKGFDQ